MVILTGMYHLNIKDSHPYVYSGLECKRLLPSGNQTLAIAERLARRLYHWGKDFLSLSESEPVSSINEILITQ